MPREPKGRTKCGLLLYGGGANFCLSAGRALQARRCLAKGAVELIAAVGHQPAVESSRHCGRSRRLGKFPCRVEELLNAEATLCTFHA
jgi:hypothetical protein